MKQVMLACVLVVVVTSSGNSQESPTVVDFPIVGCEVLYNALFDGLSLSGSIVLPNDGYRIIGYDHQIVNGELTVFINMYLDDSNIYPQVERRHWFSYQVDTPDDLVQYQDLFNLNQFCGVIVQRLYDVIPDVNPIETVNNFDLTIGVFPRQAESNDTLRVSASGRFPSGAYHILQKSISVVDQTVSVSMVVDQDETGSAAIQPFAEHFWLNPLEEGEYTVQWLINGEVVSTQPLQIDPVLFPTNEFQARFQTQPVIDAYEQVTLNVEGVLPSETHQFTDDIYLVSILNGPQNSHVYSINAEVWTQSDNFTSSPTAFDQEVKGSFSSIDNIVYFRGKINEQHIPPMKIIIGDMPVYPNLVDDWITFRITEIPHSNDQVVNIDSEGNFAIRDHLQSTDNIRTGTFTSTEIQELSSLFESTDFLELPIVTGDSFQGYVLSYNNAAVFVDPSMVDQAPVELQNMINAMLKILQGEFQTSSIDPAFWSLY